MKRTVSVDEKYKLVCLCLSGKKNDNEKYNELIDYVCGE